MSIQSRGHVQVQQRGDLGGVGPRQPVDSPSLKKIHALAFGSVEEIL